MSKVFQNRRIAAVVLLLCSAAGAQTTTRLATSDVRLELSAGKSAPRLISVAGKSQPEWKNQSEETLPSSVTTHDAAVAIGWEFRPKLSIADAHRVEFVYESTAPHLRLHWRWEARAGFGPIEHSITDENL
jgi:hypothetical protein